jgi:hypothetical protein
MIVTHGIIGAMTTSETTAIVAGRVIGARANDGTILTGRIVQALPVDRPGCGWLEHGFAGAGAEDKGRKESNCKNTTGHVISSRD